MPSRKDKNQLCRLSLAWSSSTSERLCPYLGLSRAVIRQDKHSPSPCKVIFLLLVSSCCPSEPDPGSWSLQLMLLGLLLLPAAPVPWKCLLYSVGMLIMEAKWGWHQLSCPMCAASDFQSLAACNSVRAGGGGVRTQGHMLTTEGPARCRKAACNCGITMSPRGHAAY